MTKTVDFYFDFVSPYSYLAGTQVEGLAERTGAEVNWIPFLLGGVFKATENRATLTPKGKGASMVFDLEMWSKHYNVPFMMNSNFPFSPISALRMAIAADEKGSLLAFSKKVFDACWAHNTDISDGETLVKLAGEAGLDGEKMLEMTKDQAIKDKLRANTEEAVSRGAFGAPTFIVDDKLFWGNDRILLLEKFIKGEF